MEGRLAGRVVLVSLSIAAACACTGLAGSASAQGPSAPSYRIQWPAGWDVTHVTAPRTAGGRQLGGERIRATPAEGGDAAAVIELTDIPRVDSGRASLAYEFEVALRTIQLGYAQKKGAVDLGSLQILQLGGQRVMATEITAAGLDGKLKQWFGMAMSPGHIYALSYTANEANYDRYRREFDDLKAGLVLE